MPLATMTSKGQVTIPVIVREKLHLHAGDKIDFSFVDKNEVLLRPVTKSVDDVFGCLNAATAGKKASVADMDAAIRKKVKQDFE